MSPRPLLLALLLPLLALADALPPIWLEAESPASTNLSLQRDTRRPAIMSGGVAVSYALEEAQLGDLPAGGGVLTYRFTAGQAGDYRLWLRHGFEWVRPPLAWRVDEQPWQTYPVTQLTTNLMAIAPWNELAWGDLGTVPLTTGDHTLTLKYQEPNGKRILILLDCIALADPTWRPDGCLKPGQQYDAPADRAAAAQRFALPVPAAGQRATVSLTGPWQAARYDDPNMDDQPFAPVAALPADYPFRWLGLTVPGDAWSLREELYFAHRLVYQTRLTAPAELTGHSLVLHFAGTNYLVSVFLNGQLCGTRHSVLVPWDCDLTPALRPGQENLLQIAVKGPFYAMDSGKESLHRRRNLPSTHFRYAKWLDAIYPSSKGEGDGLQVGLVFPVTAIVTGPVYTRDVFVTTSVRESKLTTSIEVANPTSVAQRVEVRATAVHDRTGEVELTMPPATLEVPARGHATVELRSPWPNPKLWWPAEHDGDLPDVYRCRTTVSVAGQPSDRREDTFGFRELTTAGRDILLNGVPWRGYNWCDVPGAGRITPGEWVRRYHAQHDSYHRFSWDHSRHFGHREQAIEFLDRQGIPSRCSTCIDGMFITQDLANPVLWQNWEQHVRQVVRAYRNHPAIFHWSIGNEVMLVNAFNVRRSMYQELEEKMAGLLAAAKQEDPTRDGYEDGSGDLGGRGPINSVHYSWEWYQDVPRQLYEYPTAPAANRMESRAAAYRWDGQRPLLGGEEFFYGGRPFNIAWFGGPGVYRDHAFANRAAGAYARMGIEGARWQGVAGASPWTDVLPGAELAFARRAVFVREYNQCFTPGTELTRTLKVFNDSRHPGDFRLAWELRLGDQRQAAGEQAVPLAPGASRELPLRLKLPAASTRQQGALHLRLLTGETEVFSDRRPIVLLPPPATPRLAAGQLAVADPGGSVTRWLAARQTPALACATPAELPATASVLLLGPGLLQPEQRAAWAAALRQAVAAGKTVIVLEQEVPFTGDELPLPGVQMADHQGKAVTMGEFAKRPGASGAICHPAALAHPVLRGLQAGDFFTWAGGETNYRHSFQAPASGGISLVVAGPELALAPMIELPLGTGTCLLSQLLIGGRLGVEPVADHLLANLLAWAAERQQRKPLATAVVTGGDTSLDGFLAGLGLDSQTLGSVAEAFDPLAAPADLGLLIVRGTPEQMAALTQARAELNPWLEAGHWLVLAGVDEGAVAGLDQLTGLRHRSRPFRAEAARLTDPALPLLLGITDRDLNQRGHELIAPWMGLYRTSSQVFSQVVDAGPNLAAFAKGDLPGQLTDGLTREEFWRYTAYFSSDLHDQLVFTYDQAETFTGIVVVASGSYRWPSAFTLQFDDGEQKLNYELEQRDGEQLFTFPPTAAKRVTMQVTALHPGEASQPLYTLDEVQLLRADPAAAQRQLLTAPAGIVSYPRGKGGILLCNLQWREPRTTADGTPRDLKALNDITADNLAKKKAIMAALLRNLGASFRAPGPAAADRPR